MDIDKWEQLKEELGRKFKILEQTTEDLTVHTQEGEVKNGTAERGKTPIRSAFPSI